MTLSIKWKVGDELLLNSELYEVIGLLGGVNSKVSEDEAIIIQSFKTGNIVVMNDDRNCIKKHEQQRKL